MRKKMVLFYFVVVILVSLGVVMLLKRQANNKITAGRSTISPTAGVKVTDVEATPGPTQLTLNEKGSPIYLIDGKIEKIYDGKPVKWDVKVGVDKILSNYKEKTLTKTVVINDDVEFVLSNLTTKKSTNTKLSSFAVGDNIAAWTVEPNSDILNLDQFTATKIIKFQ